MLFFGQTFFGGQHSLDSAATDVIHITNIKLSQLNIDNLFISNNNTLSYAESSMDWDYDTVFHADFTNNLLAGNLQFALGLTTSIRIKQRTVGDLLWRTIFDIPINSQADLNQALSYKYGKGNTDYEFGVAPVLNNYTEGIMNISTCKSEFIGAFLVEKDILIPMNINYSANYELSNTGSTIITLGRKQPFYVTNGQSDYDSGSVTVSFVNIDYETCLIDIDNGVKYRQEINKRLRNKKPKVYKTFDGYIRIIGIINPIAINQGDFYKLPTYSFNWEEIADINSTTDLYANNFTDVDYESI